MTGRDREAMPRSRSARTPGAYVVPFSHNPFPEAMRDLMRWHGLSYRQLAYMSGLSAGHLNHLTRGKRSPSEESVHAIARALHVGPEYFVEYRRNVVIGELETRPDVVDMVYGYLLHGAAAKDEAAFALPGELTPDAA